MPHNDVTTLPRQDNPIYQKAERQALFNEKLVRSLHGRGLNSVMKKRGGEDWDHNERHVFHYLCVCVWQKKRELLSFF